MGLFLSAGPEFFAPGASANVCAALEFVDGLMKQGVQVVRNDQYQDLSVSLSLQRFASAKIIRGLQTRTIIDGVSLARGSGTNGLNIHLTPAALTEKLHQLNQELGRLIGRFSVEVVGMRWMPVEWADRLLRSWDECCKFYGISRDQAEIEAHLETLGSFFAGDSPQIKRFKAMLRLLPPTGWKNPEAEKLLGLPPELSSDDPEALRDHAFHAIRRHCQYELDRHLHLGFVVAQVQRAGSRPRFEPFQDTRVSTAIDFLADLAMGGTNHAFKTFKRDGATGNGVRSVIARRLCAHADPGAIYMAASSWKSRLNREDGSAADQESVLVEAWQCFRRSFELELGATDWNLHVPSWRPPGEKKPKASKAR